MGSGAAVNQISRWDRHNDSQCVHLELAARIDADGRSLSGKKHVRRQLWWSEGKWESKNVIVVHYISTA